MPASSFKGAKLSQMLYGAATFLPGVARIFGRGAGETKSGRYCYSVWLRHLVSAYESGWRERPRVVAELGPGDSIGVGLAALVSGSESYRAFDVVRHAQGGVNRTVLEDIIALFRRRAAIPDDTEFPEVRPTLACYEFPRDILTEDVLSAALTESRLARIRESVACQNVIGSMIGYSIRWFDDAAIDPGSTDLVLSQAVLEHVDDLDEAYEAIGRWVKPNGFVSHQIDFRCHGMAYTWNGHWRCTDLQWRIVRGKRSYLLNRAPVSQHVALLRRKGFALVGCRTERRESQISRRELAPRFHSMTEEDLTTCSALIQAVRCG